MKNGLKVTLIAFALGALFLLMPQRAFAQDVTWGGWTLDYAIDGAYDGLSLQNVNYQGVPILKKAGLPTMLVFYEGNDCGPFADQFGGTYDETDPVEWADNTLIVNRTFTQNGKEWLELGMQDSVGNYVVYQVWYLSADGEINAHIFAKGLQCITDHEHYPHWRLDFDLNGAYGDRIRRYTNSGWETMTDEFAEPATTALNHQWQVQDLYSGATVDIQFDDNQWDIPGTIIPETQYTQNYAYGMLYQEREDSWGNSTYFLYENSSAESNSRNPYNGEQIDQQDLVFWYHGYLPHLATEGSELWHSTGVRMTVNLPNVPINTPPPTPTPTPTPTFTPTPIPTATPTRSTATTDLDGVASFSQRSLDTVYSSVWGYEFTPSQSIVVEALGLYDHDGNGVLTSSEASAGLWTLSGDLLTSASLAQNSVAVDGKFMAPISPLTLQPGTTYIVGAIAPGEPRTTSFPSDVYAGNGITIEGSRTSFAGTSLTYPSNPSSFLIYLGGTFKYSYASGSNPTPTSPASTATPTNVPTDTPTSVPTDTPTSVPTDTPTSVPTDTPTSVPTDTPISVPTDAPTSVPTDAPTSVPTDAPTSVPTDTPTSVPTDTPTSVPTDTPTSVPTDTPTSVPTDTPTSVPADTPTSVPVNTPIPGVIGPSTLEAESATLSGAVVASGRGSSGGQYVDIVNSSGDYIEWTVNVSASYAYDIGIHYASSGRSNRPMQLSVNGSVVAMLEFPSTRSWRTWFAEERTVYLNSGTNTIRLIAAGSSGPNIDFLTISAGTSPPPATPTPLPATPIPPPVGATSTPTPIPTNTPFGTQNTLSASSITGSATTGNRGRWDASATVTVVNQAGAPVSGVTVSGSWSSGGSGSCITGSTGQCTISKNNLKSRQLLITLTVESLELSGYTYEPSSNTASYATVSQP